MIDDINIGLIDTPLERTGSSDQIIRWRGNSGSGSSQFLSHADINVGLLIGHEAVEETPILPNSRLYVAEAVQESQLALKLLEALEWISNQPVKVVAMPFGEHHGSPFMIPMIQQLLDKDILPVAAIGNKGAGQFSAPGCYQGVLSIGATDATGNVTTYTGSLNRQDGKCLKPDVLTNGDVIADQRLLRGTSFATTRIAGHLASLRHQYPNVTYQQFISHTQLSSTVLPPEFQRRSAHGIFDLKKLNEPIKSEGPGKQSTLSISGKFTDPNLLRLIKQSPNDILVEALVCPAFPELPPYQGVSVRRTFAQNRIFHVKAPVTTLKMMHAQADILVLQSLHIPPISILHL